MPFFTPSRCVLLLNDEGVGVYLTGSGGVRYVDLVVWDADSFEGTLLGLLRKNAGGKSILILNDMVEQHYRKERIPKISPLDKAKVIKRRVAMAFPSYPIRAGLPLKEKVVEKEGQFPGGSLYLFAAVPLSDNIKRVMNVVKNTYASVSGFCLLPVESSDMVYGLSKKIVRTSEKPARWAIFVGQHQNGGVRQVVTKNGELALTRMTPMAEGLDEDVWTTEVANELRGTMGYLTRFGFNALEGLDVIVIAQNSLAEKIASKVDFECNLNVMTAAEAGNLLNVRIGRQQGDHRYADLLHVAWAAKKTSYTLPLQSVQLESINGPRRVATVVTLLLAGALCYYGYEAYGKYAEISKNGSQLAAAKLRLSEMNEIHAEEIRKKEAAGVDYMAIKQSTGTFAELERTSMKPLPVIEKIGFSLGADLSIDSMDISPSKEVVTPVDQYDPVTGALITASPEPQKFEIVLQITLPAKLDPEEGVRQINDLVERLKSNLPEHEVNIIKQVADLSYTGNFVGEATDTKVQADGKQKEDYKAQIMIKGRLL